MNENSFRVFPLGDSALTLDLGGKISDSLNKKAIALSDHFESHPFPGFIESVPAYSSVTVFFDLLAVRRNFSDYICAFDAVRYLVEGALATIEVSRSKMARIVEIPVNFGGEAGPDLESVARRKDLATEEVVSIFVEPTYRVFMLGFLPGFSYLGEVDDRIATPRHDSPRLSVPKGSVGIAGKQTGIYSLESPGGWQIIGRTETELFSSTNENVCLLAPDDRVRFVAVR